MRSKKEQLIEGTHFDTVWREQSERRKGKNPLKHSVMLLLLSPRRNQLALVTPQMIVDGERFEVMLPQYRCVRDVLGTTEKIAPSQAIQLLQQDVLQRPQQNKPEQVACSFVHEGELSGNYKKHGRLAYVYGLQAVEYNDVFNTAVDTHHQLRWCGVSELIHLPEQGQISPRKFELIMQSILVFHRQIDKKNGKLLEAAQIFLSQRILRLH